MGKFTILAHLVMRTISQKKKGPNYFVHFMAQKSLNIVDPAHVALQQVGFQYTHADTMVIHFLFT